MHVKRIKFERTGGFTGVRLGRELTLDELSDEQAHTLIRLFEELGFEELPSQMNNAESMPDQFIYTVTVETQKGEHTVTTGDVSAPEKMQELLHLLNRLARTGKKR